VILWDTSGGNSILNLVPAAQATRKVFVIKKTDSSANTLTIDPNGSELIEGASTRVLSAANESIAVICDGSNWFIINESFSSITNAMLSDMATQTFKGRTTAGTGDPEDLTVTQATAMLNAMVGDSGSGGTKGLAPAPAAGDAAANKFLKADGTWAAAGSTSPLTTKGDVYTYDTANARLAVGGNGTVLTADSSTATGLKWATVSGSSQTVVTPGSYPYTTANNEIVLVDTSSARTINLPSPTSSARITIKDKVGSANTNNITIARAGSENIEGVASNYALQADWGSITLVSDGTDWFIING
jgi:hypothetical protein